MEFLEYQNILSIPIAKSNTDTVVFTPLYLDSSGFGMMTTVSAGVFGNKTDNGNRRLLGVAGVDIRITIIEQQYPKTKIGVFGHAFAINNNGLFLIHPRYRGQSSSLSDPPSVYLDDIEHTTNRSISTMLKIEMINGKVGCMNAELDWLYFESDNKRMVRFKTTYCYLPTTGTPFLSAVSIPEANKEYIQSMPPMSENSLKESLQALDSNVNRTVEIANWIVCDIPSKAQETQPASLKLYPTASEVKQYLESYYNKTSFASPNKIPSTCNKDVLWSLLQFAKVITNHENSYLNKTLLNLHKVKNVYSMSSSGYMFSHPKNKLLDRNIHVEKRYSHPAAFNVQNMKDILVLTTSIKSGYPNTLTKNKEIISIGKSLSISPNNVFLGVIGMDIFSSHLKEILNNSSESFQYKCNGCISHNCQHVDNLRCYLIDENAYIVISNRVDVSEQGIFLGYVNGLLMTELEELNIYERHEYIDNQAECQESTESTTSLSSAQQLQTAIYYVIHLLTITIQQIIVFTSVLSSLFIHSVATATASHRNVSCTKLSVIHTIKNHSISFTGNITCSKQCEQNFAIEMINGTNLALIMVTDNCIGNGVCTRYTYHNKPLRQEDVGICNETLRYRKAFPSCYKATAQDKNACHPNGGRRRDEVKNLLFIFVFIIHVCYSFFMGEV